MMWDRVEQLLGTDNLKMLGTKRVGIVGLGSGGGFVAQSLAMSGVRQFVLIDHDVLEAVNVVRHVADSRDVGRNKAEVMADLIRLRNPDADIQIYAERVEDLPNALDNLDLLIVAVDGEGAKYRINQTCLERDLVAIYAGVYERGEGGDVVIIHPYDGPCYACWSAELREGIAQDHEAETLDYGMIGPEGTLEAEPGLWLHVTRVAGVQTDFAIKTLLQETGIYPPFPANTVILANSALEILEGQVTPPHSAVWVQIERDPDCLVCGGQLQGQAEESGSMSLDELAHLAHIELDENEKSGKQSASDQR
jgi:molybdopterin/thiamine biosynthesis adenylyltransferase